MPYYYSGVCMKRFLFGAIFMIFSTVAINAQVTFNVSPGIISGGTSVGYKINDFVPYFGFQYLGGSTTYEKSGFRYDQNNTKVAYTDKYEVSANIYMPQIGAKYFIKDLKDIKLYLNGCFSYALLSVSSKDNGVEDEEAQNAIGDNSIIGLEFGVGTEYFFSKNFSIGGEFDLRMLFASNTSSDVTTIFNPNNGTNESSTVNYKNNLNIGLTNSKITLNYYFGE